MGLDLRGTPVASKSAKETAQKAFDVLAEIQEQVAMMGLPDYPKPTNAPRPLSDIDVGSLSNRELETQMTSYVAYAMYVMPKVAEAEASYKIAVANLKKITANLKVGLFKDKTSKAEIDARVTDSPEYQEYELETLKLFAIKEILDSHYKAYSKQASALSRVIELRKLEYEQAVREASVGKYRRPAGGIPAGLRRT